MLGTGEASPAVGSAGRRTAWGRAGRAGICWLMQWGLLLAAHNADQPSGPLHMPPCWVQDQSKRFRVASAQQPRPVQSPRTLMAAPVSAGPAAAAAADLTSCDTSSCASRTAQAAQGPPSKAVGVMSVRSEPRPHGQCPPVPPHPRQARPLLPLEHCHLFTRRMQPLLGPLQLLLQRASQPASQPASLLARTLLSCGQGKALLPHTAPPAAPAPAPRWPPGAAAGCCRWPALRRDACRAWEDEWRGGSLPGAATVQHSQRLGRVAPPQEWGLPAPQAALSAPACMLVEPMLSPRTQISTQLCCRLPLCPPRPAL